MDIWQLAIIVVVGFLILKFIVKPLFKIVGIVALGLLAWWIINGGI